MTGSSGIGPILPPPLDKGIPDGAGKIEDKNFRHLLQNSLNQISELNQKADSAIKKLATGEIEDVHQVMIAVKKADLAFKTMMQIRNKLIEAYKELMRMQF